MTPSLATILYILGILALFLFDQKKGVRTSWTLWLPTIWLFISGSRHVSDWLNMGPVRSQQEYLEGSPLDATVYLVLLVAAIAVLATRRRMVAKVLQRNWPLVLFVLYCAVSILWSEFPGVALKRWIKSLGDYSMVLILLTEIDCATAVNTVLARVSFVLMPLSILFIKYYPNLGRTYASHWAGTQYFVGVCDTKNMLGMICLVFGFAALCRTLEAWRGPRRDRMKIMIVHGLVVAMVMRLLYLSDSKTSLMCFLLTGSVIAAHSFLKIARKKAILHVMVAAVVLCCFSVLFLGIGSGALETIGRNSTLTGRTDIWAVLLSVPVNPVVGTGFESFWLGQRLAYIWSFPIVDGITEAHNGYLEVYLNLGIAGLVFLAALLWTGYGNILHLLKNNPEAGRLRLGFFLIAVVYNLTEAAIRSTDLVWIALILAITALPERSPARARVGKSHLSMIAPVEYQLNG